MYNNPFNERVSVNASGLIVGVGIVMADKLSPLTESQVAKKIKDSANQIWLAGLGAYSKAEQEGNKLFDSLVKDGQKLEDRAKGPIDKKLPGIPSYRDKVEEVRERATGSWERIEKAFDERVSKALSRLNIPTRHDVEELTAKVEALSAALEELAQNTEAPKKRRSTKKTEPKEDSE